MLGRDLLILNASGTALIAGVRACEIDRDLELIETSSPTSGTARTYTPGRTGWKITLGTLSVNPTQELLLVEGAAVTVRVTVRGGDYLQGSAYFERCVISGNVENLAKGSFTLRGTGPLSPVT